MHSLKDWQPLTFIGSAYILKWGDSVEGRGEEDKESVGDKGTGGKISIHARYHPGSKGRVDYS